MALLRGKRKINEAKCRDNCDNKQHTLNRVVVIHRRQGTPRKWNVAMGSWKGARLLRISILLSVLFRGHL